MKYIITSRDQKYFETLKREIANFYGIHRAETMVKEWFERYDAFIYNENCELLFVKSKYLGYWQIIDENMEQYRYQ